MIADEVLYGITMEDINRLINIEHSDPHSILGAHYGRIDGKDGVIIRGFHPDAVKCEVLVGSKRIQMEHAGPAGLFWIWLPGYELPLPHIFEFYFLDNTSWTNVPPYQFMPTLGEQDLHFVGEGKHYNLYDKLGAHERQLDGINGISFAVWAPNAKRVSVIGEFNNWDGRLYPMRSMGSSGIWELFIPGIGLETLYKYELKTSRDEIRIKSDPFAFYMELRPGTASIVWDINRFTWSDDNWLSIRSKRNPMSHPMNIYEVHLGSWMRVVQDNYRWASYRELAAPLASHCKKYGFTHVELMPIMEHPFDASWGYQVTGYFAPTSRFGTPDDFKYFVNYLHSERIGVILDWVPAHFPKDDFSLRLFDGTALYEHEDPRKAEHKDWGTLIFNYGRNEVRNFLVSNALFWLDKYHIDGLRVDAVASMLYLDYSRNEGDWIPNRYGGNENLEAIEFVKEFNGAVYGRFPGCFTVAEESTAWKGVTTPTYLGGLGFGFKWDMGWMHDTLKYFSKDPIHRSFHQNDLTFSMMYAYSENFILPLSHDEVVYGKGSLLRKMPGDEWQKFANLRLLFAYMFTHPGKKLLMAGSELGTWNEWDHESCLENYLLDYAPHQKFSKFVQDIGALYLSDSSLWTWDCKPEGFSWIDCNDHFNSVISYLRKGPEGFLLCVLNFTPVVRENYRVGVPADGDYVEVINSDSSFYGGSDVGNGGVIRTVPKPHHGYSQHLRLTIPPLGCLILKKF
ncbi:MAG: 1,4-alpha-glucan branching protein GlgB [Syntrophaceae bacterium]|nr:1,4-alpha-glucan branching protein GlgB [Syntrophaceae bacterium]